MVKADLAKIDDCAIISNGENSTNANSFQEMNLKSNTLSSHENNEEHNAENQQVSPKQKIIWKTDYVTEEFGIKEKVIMNVTDIEKKYQKL